MSRYSVQISDTQEICYGYDRPLMEYFIQLYDSAAGSEPVFELGTVATTVPHPDFPEKIRWSRGEILEIFQGYQAFIPEPHITALVLDLPF